MPYHCKITFFFDKTKAFRYLLLSAKTLKSTNPSPEVL